MKLFITIIALLLCLTSKAQRKLPLTITYLNREDSSTELIGRNGGKYWKATCKTVPDTLKLGDRITALPIGRMDSCLCIFKRYK